jgi:uncharacterized OB-fold protein
MPESGSHHPFDVFAELFPQVTELNAPFWEGLAAGEVRLQQCQQCGVHQHPPESFCYSCGAASPVWTPVSAHGTVYSYIIVHQPYHPAFRPFIPYTVAIVQLDEGPRLLGAMLGLETPIAIGDRVQPRLEAIDGERSMLLFEPENGC